MEASVVPDPELTVVIPTRDRRELLLATLEALAGQIGEAAVEILVVDDGSKDGTGAGAAQWARNAGVALRVLNGTATGPAGARNLALGEASGACCLLLDDDVRPAAGMLDRHLSFHREHQEPRAALLGRVIPAAEHDSELARWAHEEGALFGYRSLRPDQPVPPASVWSAQVSVKAELLRKVGGFDEGLRFFEDVELANRLIAAGAHFSYDPESVGEHQQEITLEGLMARARESAAYFRALAERVPETPLPRRPGTRHRVKAGVLTALNAARVRPRWVKRATWRFLVDEAQREALYGSVEGGLAVGSSLERLAAKAGS